MCDLARYVICADTRRGAMNHVIQEMMMMMMMILGRGSLIDVAVILNGNSDNNCSALVLRRWI